MVTKYYYAAKDRWEGPVTFEELKLLAAREELKRSDRIWTEGMPGWEPAEFIPAIFEGLPPDISPDTQLVAPPPSPAKDLSKIAPPDGKPPKPEITPAADFGVNPQFIAPPRDTAGSGLNLLMGIPTGGEKPTDTLCAPKAEDRVNRSKKVLIGLGVMVVLALLAALINSTWHGMQLAAARAADARRLAEIRTKAETGDIEAQCDLGIYYSDGELGAAVDYAESLKWWRKAAEQNDGAAQASLGWIYAYGTEGSQDLLEAYKWTQLSVENTLSAGDKATEKARLADLETRMTASQIDAGRRLVRLFKAAAWRNYSNKNETNAFTTMDEPSQSLPRVATLEPKKQSTLSQPDNQVVKADSSNISSLVDVSGTNQVQIQAEEGLTNQNTPPVATRNLAANGVTQQIYISNPIEPLNTTNEFYKRGQLKMKNGDSAGALLDFNKAIELNPADADSYNARGLVKESRGDLNGAFTDNLNAIKLNPKLANREWLQKLIGKISQQKQAENEIQRIAAQDQAGQIRKDEAKQAYLRGVAKRSDGDWDGAIAEFSRTIQLDPEFTDAYIQRGNMKQAKGDLFGAQADYRKAGGRTRTNPIE